MFGIKVFFAITLLYWYVTFVVVNDLHPIPTESPESEEMEQTDENSVLLPLQINVTLPGVPLCSHTITMKGEACRD